MTTTAQVMRSAAFNWLALIVTVVTSFFMSPFVVRSLGNDAYGVWTLLNSTVAYLGLLDLGLRGTVTRFVSRDYAQRDHKAVSGVVSTILWFRVFFGVAAVSISFALSSSITGLFQIPLETHAIARWAFVLLAGSFAVSLVSGVFGGVLVALHRFDLVSGITISQTIVRAIGVIYLLNSGYSLLGLAVWDFVVVVLAGMALWEAAYRVYPELRIAFRVDRRVNVREIVGYSVYAYVINVCIQVIYYTDNLVVGALLSAGAVTVFSIGGGLVQYLRQVVSSLTVTFMPIVSGIEGEDQQHQLRRVLIYGTRAALLIALPIIVALFTRGRTFIGLWMGEEYARASGRVLEILLLSEIFAIANFTSSAIGLGLGKHRPVALWATAEAASNLALSVWLANRLGLEGVAWGTVIPSVVIHLLLWPRYVCRLVDIPLGNYFWQGWARPGLAALPFAIACAIADRVWVPANLVQFVLQMCGLLPIFILGVGICFAREGIDAIRKTVSWAPERVHAMLIAIRRS